MRNDRSAKKRIIRESYARLLLLGIVTLMATNICSFIDNIVIGRYLDTRALAAVGYYSPLTVVTGIGYVVILGTSSLCGNYIGSGQPRKVNALFTTAFITLTVVFIAITLLFIAACDPLSSLLGAKDDARVLLIEYLLGYVPGIVFSSLSALLMSLTSYNNEISRSYVATAAMLFCNILFDVLLVKPMGIFGIGLASTLSSIAAFATLLPSFVRKNQTVHLERGAFDAGLLFQAAKRGLPALLFSAGMLVKNALLNYTLMVYTGYEGIAVINLLGSVCAIAGTASGGCTNAYATLASLSYGEEDREGFIDAFHTAARTGLAITAVLAAAIAALSTPLSSFFFEPGTGVWKMARNMFALGFLFFPINLLINLLMNSYKSQGRMALVNVMSFLETAMTGVFAWLTVPRMGSDAAWLANTWSDLIALGLILISVCVWKGGVRFNAADLLKLPDGFGAGPDEFVEYAASSMGDVSAISKAVVAHCERRGVDRRKAFLAGLCVEELVRNILQYGVDGKRRYSVNVRVVCKEALTIRIQDDCRKFDPLKRMEMYAPETPEKNIGLRMVARLATHVDYYNNAGINTLIMKIS